MGDLSLQGVARRFGPFEAIGPIDLHVASGEFCVLLGPSGCGKSTLLRMIAGLEEISAGRLFIDGRDMTKAPPHVRDVAMVFQSCALYPHMDAGDNISFSLRMARVPKQEIARRVAWIRRYACGRAGRSP